MKHISILITFACILISGLCDAQDSAKPQPKASQPIAQAQPEPRDLQDDDKANYDDTDKDRPVTNVGVMHDGQSYDEEDGLPDMVDSDSDMEINY